MTAGRDNEHERRARAYLLRVTEPPAPAVAELVSQEGSIIAAQLIRKGQVSQEVAQETKARRDRDLVEQDFAEAGVIGARLIIPEDAEWPSWPLTMATSEPLALWALGTSSLSQLTERSVSIVGARAATGYGEHVSQTLAHDLAVAGYTVLSGAAYGIDGAAHRGALTATGSTIAVLACGLDISYPAGHAGLLKQIAQHGLVVSEYPPGITPAKHRFLIRNRLIAALSIGTVIVEAGRRSGARNTTNTATAFGKVVMAVPGPITSAMSLGCHELLRSGEAALVCSAAEVIELISPIGSGLVAESHSPAQPTDRLSSCALRVHDALGPRSARSVQRIMIESGLPAAEVLGGLTELELAGLAIGTDSGWRRCVST